MAQTCLIRCLLEGSRIAAVLIFVTYAVITLALLSSSVLVPAIIRIQSCNCRKASLNSLTDLDPTLSTAIWHCNSSTVPCGTKCSFSLSLNLVQFTSVPIGHSYCPQLAAILFSCSTLYSPYPSVTVLLLPSSRFLRSKTRCKPVRNVMTFSALFSPENVGSS